MRQGCLTRVPGTISKPSCPFFLLLVALCFFEVVAKPRSIFRFPVKEQQQQQRRETMAAFDPDDVKNDFEHLTLSSFIMMETRDPNLALLMNAIQLSCKSITRAVRKAGIAGLYGLAGSDNSSGDAVKKLDVLSNDIMITALKNSHVCSVLVSEEEEEPIIIEAAKSGKYCVAFDPLDGSSNIDCNVSTGTIFAVYEKKTEGTSGTIEDVLRAGIDIKVAGYCMYGSATELVLTFYGSGVHRFTLDPSLGEFMHISKNVRVPDKPKAIYSCNEGNSESWDDAIKAAVHHFKTNNGKPYAARYVGSMVSDVHRTLLYGGVFLYPADKKSPLGKLRVLYEGFPMALIVEQAGGLASTGMFKGSIQRVLEINPMTIHERCPIILGTPSDVTKVLGYYDQLAK
ncbi:unnamed protein product [Phaeothamnion confervicola]